MTDEHREDSVSPNVFDYVDYREYLKDWFFAHKAQHPSFSHRALAKRVKSSDPSFLVNIIGGRRNISSELWPRLMRVLELSEDEERYFQLLVQFTQAKNASERERIWAAVSEMRSRQDRPQIDGDRFLYLSDRVYPAVRALSQCTSFRPDPALVAEALTPPISVEQAEEALALLQRLGFLVREGDVLRPAEPVVRTDAIVPQMASAGYHQQNHALAGDVLDRLWDEEGLDDETGFLGLTMAVPHDRIAEVRQMLWEAQLQVLHRCKEWGSERDRVYQLNIQLFPASKRL